MFFYNDRRFILYKGTEEISVFACFIDYEKALDNAKDGKRKYLLKII